MQVCGGASDMLCLDNLTHFIIYRILYVTMENTKTEVIMMYVMEFWVPIGNIQGVCLVKLVNGLFIQGSNWETWLIYYRRIDMVVII